MGKKIKAHNTIETDLTAGTVTKAPSEAPSDDVLGMTVAEKSDRTRPGFVATDMARHGGQSDVWICLAVFAVLLCAALIFVKYYRANR